MSRIEVTDAFNHQIKVDGFLFETRFLKIFIPYFKKKYFVKIIQYNTSVFL